MDILSISVPRGGFSLHLLPLIFLCVCGVVMTGDEMPAHSTALPSSPTPPHTWNGHFISECSKWKGDPNLPRFLRAPPSFSFYLPHTVPHTADGQHTAGCLSLPPADEI